MHKFDTQLHDGKKFIMRSSFLSHQLEQAKQRLSKLGKIFTSQKNRVPRIHKRLILIIFLIVTVLSLIPTEQQINPRKVIPLVLTQPQNTANENAVAIPNTKTPVIAIIEPIDVSGSWQSYTIKKGDSVYRIFRKYHISADILHQLIDLAPVKQAITKINTGDKMAFFISNNKQLIQLRISGEQQNQTYQLREDGKYILTND